MNHQVTPWQMGVLFLSFMTGSSIVNVPGPVISLAQNGAWISLCIAYIIGLVLLTVLLRLYRKNYTYTLVDFGIQGLSRYGALLLMLPFMLYLLIMITWITMDVGGFMNNTMMRNTPPYIFHYFMLLSVAMTVRAGIEVMVRMFTIIMSIILFFLLAILVLCIVYYNPTHLLPVLPDGWMPVMKGSYFTFGFPYAEVVVFGMFLSYVKQQSASELPKYMYASLTLNVIVLVVTTLCCIMVFGPVSGLISYPIFSVSRLIEFADFLQRIETVVGISFIMSSYMKSTVALFALNLMICKLSGVKDERVFVFPISLVCFFLSLTMYEGNSEFKEQVLMVWPLINLFFGVIPFLIIVFVSFIRRVGNKHNQ